MSEFRQGSFYWSTKESGNPFLIARGGIGTQALIDELSTAGIDVEAKENSIKLVKAGCLLVRGFLKEGGLIGLDGKPFVEGLENLDEFIDDSETFRRRLKRDVIISYRANDYSLRNSYKRGSLRRDFELDIQKLGIHPNKRVYFVDENADRALGYRVTETRGTIDFGVLNNGRLIENGRISRIQSGLMIVIRNSYMSDREEIAVALTAVVNQSMYDLAEEVRISRTENPVVARRSRGLLSRMLNFFHMGAIPL